MRKMYVCSRPIKNTDGEYRRHLLGILTQNDNKTYQFEYKLGDDCDNTNLLLPFFPDANKIYDDHDTRLLLDDYLPSENDTPFIAQIIQQAGLKKYDEWEWLCAFEPIDENSETKLYETLPEDIIIHDAAVLANTPLIDNDILDELDDEWDEYTVSENEFDDEQDDFEPENIFEDYVDNEINNDATDIDTDMPFDDIKTDDIVTDEQTETFDFDDITMSDPIVEPSNAAIPSVTPSVIRVKKTTVVRTIKVPQDAKAPIMTADDAVALVQKRLEQNIKERRENLKQTLSADNPKNSS